MPLDSFVHAAATVEHAGARIDAVVFVGDDGSRLTAFGQDETRGEWSAAHAAEDGVRRWWPVHIAYNYGAGAVGTPGAVFADAACSRATGIKDAYDALCPITTVVEFVPVDACQFAIQLHDAGAVEVYTSIAELRGALDQTPLAAS